MIKSGFFNSVNGDRKYQADFFAEYFASFIGNGVFPNPSTGFQVIANGDMSVNLNPGKAWINGYYVSNDSDYNLQIDVADGVLNRIDRIVLQLNYLNREIVPVVKKGTFASNPIAPSLQRDADAYEIALADVFVGQGVVSISQANITDQRLNSELCGIVHGTVDQVDTTTIFNQYQEWLDETKQNYEGEFDTWKQQQEQAFNDWFQTIQDILDGDVAGNLANRITLVEQELAAHQADDTQIKHKAKQIGLEDVDGLFAALNVEEGMKELFTNVSNGKSLVGGAITGVDDSIVIPTDPTFQQLADAIGSIKTKSENRSPYLDGIEYIPLIEGYTVQPASYSKFATYFRILVSAGNSGVGTYVTNEPLDLTDAVKIIVEKKDSSKSGTNVMRSFLKLGRNSDGNGNEFVHEFSYSTDIKTEVIDVSSLYGDYYVSVQVSNANIVNSYNVDFYKIIIIYA